MSFAGTSRLWSGVRDELQGSDDMTAMFGTAVRSFRRQGSFLKDNDVTEYKKECKYRLDLN